MPLRRCLCPVSSRVHGISRVPDLSVLRCTSWILPRRFDQLLQQGSLREESERPHLLHRAAEQDRLYRERFDKDCRIRYLVRIGTTDHLLRNRHR